MPRSVEGGLQKVVELPEGLAKSSRHRLLLEQEGADGAQAVEAAQGLLVPLLSRYVHAEAAHRRLDARLDHLPEMRQDQLDAPACCRYVSGKTNTYCD